MSDRPFPVIPWDLVSGGCAESLFGPHGWLPPMPAVNVCRPPEPPEPELLPYYPREVDKRADVGIRIHERYRL